MDITKIKRRERRFYRTEVNGEIVYTETPQKNKKPETEIKQDTTQKKTKEIPVKTLKSIQENTKLTAQEKKQIIDKILLDLRNTINPDIDEIAEMIYAQLSVKDVNVTQESVKQIVQNNAHHRSSRNSNSVTIKTNSEKGENETFDFLNDRKELETVIDDIVEENKKEDIREKTKKEKIEQEKKKDTEKKSEKGTTEKSSKKADAKDKTKAEPEKKKDEFKLDFGDDEEEISDSDDELGLKF